MHITHITIAIIKQTTVTINAPQRSLQIEEFHRARLFLFENVNSYTE